MSPVKRFLRFCVWLTFPYKIKISLAKFPLKTVKNHKIPPLSQILVLRFKLSYLHVNTIFILFGSQRHILGFWKRILSIMFLFGSYLSLLIHYEFEFFSSTWICCLVHLVMSTLSSHCQNFNTLFYIAKMVNLTRQHKISTSHLMMKALKKKYSLTTNEGDTGLENY